MARKSVTNEFVPQEYLEQPFAARRIYGVVFTSAEQREVWKAIAEQTGLSSPMDGFGLTMQVHDELRDKHNMVAAYIDDVYVHICNDLGVDWKKFPHNTPKLPTDGFTALAATKLAMLSLPKSEIQWAVQRRKWWDLWKAWVKDECIRCGCDGEGCDCRDLYEQPNFWELAKQFEQARHAKATLLSSIDAKPRGKSVKIANDALARIAITSKRSRARSGAST